MRICCALMLAALSGCHAYSLDVEGQIAQRAALPIDVQPPPVMPMPRPVNDAVDGAPHVRPMLKAAVGAPQVGGQPKIDEQKPDMWERLTRYTKDIPGGDATDFRLPAKGTPAERAAAIRKRFPPLAPLPALPPARSGPDGRPMTLADLQQVALRQSPLIRQAHHDVDAARGAALQAGLYPNPNFGYDGSSIGQGDQDGQRSPGQQGGFVEQTIVTMGKLTLAREAALRDVQIREQHLRQAESELQTQVRQGYFAVLSAQKNYETNRALAQLTDELYNVLLQQLLVNQVAAYEPMQIRVLASEARNRLTQAQNRYQTAWKQLAATLGTPLMPLTALAGQIDMPVPHFDHDRVLDHVLTRHSDVLSARLGVDKARFLARLAEVQPYPDLTLRVGFQKDYTTPPFGTIANVNVAFPFPLWNRNQGNIQSAQANLRRALDDDMRVRNELASRVAEVFERYDNNRTILNNYRMEILPDQVQAYRAAVARHAALGGKDVPYNDLVTSQQTLAGLIANYLAALGDQWTAVVDIANLLQTRDLFQVQFVDEVAPVPDMRCSWPRHVQ
jgi:cobalt-zinc-cadmium efflux system outer membrane protein